MHNIIFYALILAVGYCALMWLVLAVISLRDVETETFHLGLCFILAVGFLGMIYGGG
jgi:hypothetical protein